MSRRKGEMAHEHQIINAALGVRWESEVEPDVADDGDEESAEPEPERVGGDPETA